MTFMAFSQFSSLVSPSLYPVNSAKRGVSSEQYLYYVYNQQKIVKRRDRIQWSSDKKFMFLLVSLWGIHVQFYINGHSAWPVHNLYTLHGEWDANALLYGQDDVTHMFLISDLCTFILFSWRKIHIIRKEISGEKETTTNLV